MNSVSRPPQQWSVLGKGHSSEDKPELSAHESCAGSESLTLRLAVGAYCLLLGTLALVVPHQFSTPLYAALQPGLAWLGAGLVAAGILLLGTVFWRTRWLDIGAHTTAGVVLLVLAVSLAATGGWTGTVVDGTLGAGIILSPWLVRRTATPAGTKPRDLLAILVGIANVLIAGLLLVAPVLFIAPVYDLIRSMLPLYGVGFLIGGVALLGVHLRRGAPPGVVWGAHVLGAAPLLGFFARVALPTLSWTAVAYYGGFGVLILVLPWLAPRLQQMDGRSLRVRFAVALAGAAVVPLILIGALDGDRETRSVTAAALRQEQALAVVLARDVADYVGLHRAAAAALATQRDLVTRPPDEQQAILRSFSASYPDVLGFSIRDADGNILARSDNRPFTSVAGRQGFEDARRTNAPSVDIFISPLVNRAVFAFGAPIEDAQGNFAGLVTVTLESSRIANVLARTAGETGGQAYLVDAAGRAIADPESEFTTSFADFSAEPPVAALRATPLQSGSLLYAEDGDQLAGFAPVPDLGWGIVVERPAVDALASVRAGSNAALVLLLLVIVVLGAVGWLVAGQLAGPLRALAGAAERLAEGDASVTLPATRVTETAALTAAFAAMRKHLAASAAASEQAHARTESERATLASLMGSMSDGLLVVDSDLKIRYCNAHAGALWGAPPAALIGTALMDSFANFRERLLDPDGVASAWADAAARVDEMPSFDAGVRGPPPVDVLVHLFPIHVGTSLRSGVGILLRDVTAERDLARTKDELVSVVSHELRTPLASVVGFAELLLTREWPEAKRREFLGTILAEAKRLTALVNDFLDLQRLGGGMSRISPLPTDIRPAIQQAVASLGPDELRRIELEIPEGLPPVFADADRLQQILMNLLGNARKYSPSGGSIIVSAQQKEGVVEVAVSDKGLGIPPEALPHLFKSFYRVDNSDRRSITGTGLGLAIVRQLVMAHGGSVRAESPGQGLGATFAFTLPVANGAASPAPSSPVLPASAKAPGHILIVEDDDAFAGWLGEVLRRDGYVPRRVASGEDALRSIEAERPGVMLLDLRLRDQLDGWGLLAALRALPATHDLPVVIVSSEDDRARGQALGVDDYLVKPVDKDLLLERLAQVAPLFDGSVVLVVEDDVSTRELVLRTFELAGTPARGVGSGEEALALLDAQPAIFGLIVLDLGLPGIDGFAVLEALRARPSVASLPVIIFTGRELATSEKHRLMEHAHEVVRKGGGVPLRESVERWLSRPAVTSAPSEVLTNGRTEVKIDADVADLVPGFLAGRRYDVALIRAAAERADYGLIRRLGHNMRGAGATFGFIGISQIGGRLQVAAQNSNSPAVRREVEALAHYLEHVDVIYG